MTNGTRVHLHLREVMSSCSIQPELSKNRRRLRAQLLRVKELRREATDLKEVVAEQTLALRLLKKDMLGDGDDRD
ncbi:hypothetical protein [Yoonia sp. SDW83-1]|uniref:hypothetical protein n=1 Tax=Yoonia sp. SDW83-1 TaxID=3366945 RepID=UPI00398C7CEF